MEGGTLATQLRRYDHDRDFDRVGRFLVDVYAPGPHLANWLQPRWEYMFSHPNIDAVDLATIGIAEDGGEIIAVTHPEHRMAFAYFQIKPGHESVTPDMVDWAMAHFGGWSHSLEANVLGLWINDGDTTLAALAAEQGFVADDRFVEEHSRMSLAEPVAAGRLPSGYRLQSLADENDFEKINRVLWRGFGHEGPAPDEEIQSRRTAQETPGFRADLTIVAVAPDDEYVSYAGMWVVPENRVAYVEPVATDPNHRRLGLGRAAVLEALRRARAESADAAWVGSGQAFYHSLGFTTPCQTTLWVRRLRE